MEALAEKIKTKVAETGFDNSVKLNCGSDGVITINGTSVSTQDGPADCTISLSKDDLESMIAGELSPTAAFMQGKLKVEGDMSVAMQLSQIL
ncbi:SCP2 sterol-binding domain-containing protein [Nitratireductor indicus]|uniref:SCP2 sterol-binding domain-containing protein n=1 Tax=Nitratireductor indicus TaxID=721133 RepID=UPI00287668CB|nr:SCP2 sterol-binding domain-containing protein [Nitratireductor indicus]MDS1137870.1 SCP2 sterol-binding domain-containing protein [Nitratireductor indicus]